MPAQFGGFSPFSNPTTSSQTTSQASGIVAKSSNSQLGGSAAPTDSGPGLSPISTINGASPTGLPSDSILPSQTTFRSVDTSLGAFSSPTGFATTFTTTVTDSPLGTGLGRASSALSGVTGASSSEPAPLPEPVLREQSVVGISIGIGVWLLIIIAVLSCLLWRKRKRNGIVKPLADEAPPEMANGFTEYEEMAAAPMVRPAHLRVAERAPSLPPPFFSRAASTDGEIPPPLRSHPVSRGNDGLPSPTSPLAPYREAPRGRSRSSGRSRALSSGTVPSLLLSSSPEPIEVRSSSPAFPILSTSPPGSLPASPTTSGTVTRSGSSKSSTIVKMRSLSRGGEAPQSPDQISDLPPSLGKLNSWLEENRRRSRMTDSGILALEGVPHAV